MTKLFFLKYDLIKNSIIIGIMTLISRITGLIRDICIAHFVGSSRVADLFLISMRIPNTFRAIFADGAFNNTFIPMLAKMKEDNDKRQINIFIKNVFSILLYILLIFTIAILIFMPILVMMFAGGIKKDPEMFNDLVMISRITFPFLLFISISRLFSGILEIHNKFCLAAFSPIIINISSVLGILFAGYFSFKIALWGGIAFSIGGILQAYVLYYANNKNGFGIVPHPINAFYRNFKKIINDQYIKKFIKNIIPSILSGGIYNINIMVSTFFASSIVGAVSWIYYAERLVQLPLGIISIAIGTALLPKLSSAKNNTEIIDYFNKAVKAVLTLLIPVIIGLVILGKYLIEIIYKSGTFSINDVDSVNKVLIILSFALPFLSLTRYVSIVFYSKNDTKTPMKVAIFCAFLNIILSYSFIKLLGFIGVAISSILVSIINFIILYWIMHRNRFCRLNISNIKCLVTILLSTIIMGVVVFYLKSNIAKTWNELSRFQKTIEIIGISMIGAIIYIGTSIFLYIVRNFLKKTTI